LAHVGSHDCLIYQCCLKHLLRFNFICHCSICFLGTLLSLFVRNLKRKQIYLVLSTVLLEKLSLLGNVEWWWNLGFLVWIRNKTQKFLVESSTVYESERAWISKSKSTPCWFDFLYQRNYPFWICSSKTV